MADTSQSEQPSQASEPQTNGLPDGVEDDEKSKMRPADIDADMREMERRKRVEMIMNSRLFREELERIIESQLKDGNGPAGLLQQISDMMGMQGGRLQSGNVFRSANCVVPINDIRGVESMGYAKGEKILRCKLAAVYRLMDLYGWSQGVYNQITARLNQDQEHFLVNPFGMLYHEITASSLVKIDMQGQIVEAGTTNFGVNVTGFLLHAAIHAARPDVKCIIHVHTPSVLAVSSLKCGLLPLCQEAVVIGEISQHPFLGGLSEPEEREKIARNLGPLNKVMFLTNHGVVCCGETVEEAFFNVYNTVLACETQIKLMPMGVDNLVLVSDEARKQIYEAARRPPDSATKQPDPADLPPSGIKKEKQWRVGGVEFEALMRMLDNAGFRTGYIYRHPLVKGEPPRPRNDVEVPPAVSSLGYLLEEEEMYRQGHWKKYADGRKTHDRTRWLNSPNVYQKVEILETGTPDPKKITKWVDANAEEWVAEGSPTHSSTPVKIESALQFVPKNTDPKEFKKLQQQIKDNRRSDKITSGPQSHILEGVSWEEAKKLQDANISATGDQVILVGAASKGIIQRGFQHNALVYKTPYAKNPFDTITDEELEEYKKVVERKQRGESFDEDQSESEPLSSSLHNSRPTNEESVSAAKSPLLSPTSAASETEEESRDEPRVLRIETKQVPRPSQAEVVLSDAEGDLPDPGVERTMSLRYPIKAPDSPADSDQFKRTRSLPPDQIKKKDNNGKVSQDECDYCKICQLHQELKTNKPNHQLTSCSCNNSALMHNYSSSHFPPIGTLPLASKRACLTSYISHSSLSPLISRVHHKRRPPNVVGCHITRFANIPHLQRKKTAEDMYIAQTDRLLCGSLTNKFVQSGFRKEEEISILTDSSGTEERGLLFCSICSKSRTFIKPQEILSCKSWPVQKYLLEPAIHLTSRSIEGLPTKTGENASKNEIKGYEKINQTKISEPVLEDTLNVVNNSLLCFPCEECNNFNANIQDVDDKNKGKRDKNCSDEFHKSIFKHPVEIVNSDLVKKCINSPSFHLADFEYETSTIACSSQQHNFNNFSGQIIPELVDKSQIFKAKGKWTADANNNDNSVCTDNKIIALTECHNLISNKSNDHNYYENITVNDVETRSFCSDRKTSKISGNCVLHFMRNTRNVHEDQFFFKELCCMYNRIHSSCDGVFHFCENDDESKIPCVHWFCESIDNIEYQSYAFPIINNEFKEQEYDNKDFINDELNEIQAVMQCIIPVEFLSPSSESNFSKNRFHIKPLNQIHFQDINSCFQNESPALYGKTYSIFVEYNLLNNKYDKLLNSIGIEGNPFNENENHPEIGMNDSQKELSEHYKMFLEAPQNSNGVFKNIERVIKNNCKISLENNTDEFRKYVKLMVGWNVHKKAVSGKHLFEANVERENFENFEINEENVKTICSRLFDDEGISPNFIYNNEHDEIDTQYLIYLLKMSSGCSFDQYLLESNSGNKFIKLLINGKKNNLIESKQSATLFMNVALHEERMNLLPLPKKITQCSRIDSSYSSNVIDSGEKFCKMVVVQTEGTDTCDSNTVTGYFSQSNLDLVFRNKKCCSEKYQLKFSTETVRSTGIACSFETNSQTEKVFNICTFEVKVFNGNLNFVSDSHGKDKAIVPYREGIYEKIFSLLGLKEKCVEVEYNLDKLWKENLESLLKRELMMMMPVMRTGCETYTHHHKFCSIDTLMHIHGTKLHLLPFCPEKTNFKSTPSSLSCIRELTSDFNYLFSQFELGFDKNLYTTSKFLEFHSSCELGLTSHCQENDSSSVLDPETTNICTDFSDTEDALLLMNQKKCYSCCSASTHCTCSSSSCSCKFSDSSPIDISMSTSSLDIVTALTEVPSPIPDNTSLDFYSFSSPVLDMEDPEFSLSGIRDSTFICTLNESESLTLSSDLSFTTQDLELSRNCSQNLSTSSQKSEIGLSPYLKICFGSSESIYSSHSSSIEDKTYDIEDERYSTNDMCANQESFSNGNSSPEVVLENENSFVCKACQLKFHQNEVHISCGNISSVQERDSVIIPGESQCSATVNEWNQSSCSSPQFLEGRDPEDIQTECKFALSFNPSLRNINVDIQKGPSSSVSGNISVQVEVDCSVEAEDEHHFVSIQNCVVDYKCHATKKTCAQNDFVEIVSEPKTTHKIESSASKQLLSKCNKNKLHHKKIYKYNKSNRHSNHNYFENESWYKSNDYRQKDRIKPQHKQECITKYKALSFGLRVKSKSYNDISFSNDINEIPSHEGEMFIYNGGTFLPVPDCETIESKSFANAQAKSRSYQNIFHIEKGSDSSAKKGNLRRRTIDTFFIDGEHIFAVLTPQQGLSPERRSPDASQMPKILSDHPDDEINLVAPPMDINISNFTEYIDSLDYSPFSQPSSCSSEISSLSSLQLDRVPISDLDATDVCEPKASTDYYLC